MGTSGCGSAVVGGPMREEESPQRGTEAHRGCLGAPLCFSVVIFFLLAQVARAGPPPIAPCPIDGNCADVAAAGTAGPIAVGATAQVHIAFQQGDDDSLPGGVDEIAALTLTVGIPGLELADCSAPGSDGLNPSFIVPPRDPSPYRVIVQNLTCVGRTSCLCPTNGEPVDAYVNLLLVGNPATAGVQSLPSGELLGIVARVRPGAGPRVPLHLYSALDDRADLPRPPGGAWLSIGDGQAVDRTIDTGTEAMNVRVADGELTIVNPTATATATATASAPPTSTASATAPAPTATAEATATPSVQPVPCTGDCNSSGEVTINELIAGVGIALGSQPLSTCAAFDCDDTGEVGVSCLVAGVNAALKGCP